MNTIQQLRSITACAFTTAFRSTTFNIALGLAVSGSLLVSGAQAQHTMHNMGGGDSEVSVQTMPADDAVMASQPEMLMLNFGPMVRLVKLAVRTSESDLLDIGFRYSPRAGHEFTQRLPQLQAADYYTVEWAVLDDTESLVKGNFHFAVGPNARPPSYYLNQMEQMPHIMAPDYRLLGPGAQ
jgi:methionine-rich copper-binding protein CopC